MRSDNPDLGGFLDRFLSSFTAEITLETERTYVLESHSLGTLLLVADGEEKIRSDATVDVFEYLLWEVSKEATASQTGMLALHAGSPGWGGAGRGPPAASVSGKSTLTAGLTAAGWTT